MATWPTLQCQQHKNHQIYIDDWFILQDLEPPQWEHLGKFTQTDWNRGVHGTVGAWTKTKMPGEMSALCLHVWKSLGGKEIRGVWVLSGLADFEVPSTELRDVLLLLTHRLHCGPFVVFFELSFFFACITVVLCCSFRKWLIADQFNMLHVHRWLHGFHWNLICIVWPGVF